MAKLKTGRHTSAIKELRKSKRRRERNVEQKKRIRSLAKRVEDAIAKKDAETAKSLLQEAFSAWDKAARKNLVHWKAAARKKSRLSSRFHQFLSAAKS